MSCGVYKITNLINNHCYIGQSIYIEQRWRRHKSNINNANGEEYNYPLYRAIRKYGISNFSFEILEECLSSQLNEREQFYISYYKPEYNQTIEGQITGGYIKLTPITLQSLRQDLLDNKLPYRELSSKYNIGLDCISRINQGHAYHDDNINYPIRKVKRLEQKYCPICGKPIQQDSTMCISCYNNSRSQAPTKEELYNTLVKLNGNFTKAGQYYNISDNGVRKWCKKYGLPYHSKDYKKIFERK